MNFEDIWNNLEDLTPHQLWRIGCLTTKYAADEDRLKPIRLSLKKDMKIIFFHSEKNKYVEAIITKVKRTTVSVITENKEAWAVSLSAIKPDGLEMQNRPKPHGTLTRFDLGVGDTIGFHHEGSGGDVSGVILKLNPRRAKIKLRSGEVWGIPYQHLFQIVDASCSSQPQEKVIEGQVLTELPCPEDNPL